MPGKHDGYTDKTARSDHHVRLEFLHNSKRLPDSLHGRKSRVEDLEDIPAVQPFGRHQFHGIARGRHDILFQTDIVTDVQNLRLWFLLFYFIGDGDGRVNMTTRASACYNHSHTFPPLVVILCLDIFNMIPADPINSQSAFPP